MKAPILTTKRLILKPLSISHLSQEYVDWLNDSEVYKFLDSGGDYTLEKLQEYIQAVIQKDIFFWGIHIRNTGQHIGNIKIDPINHRHGLGEYGIMMGEKSEWGKGYAKESSLKAIDFCFTELNIRKLTLGVVSDNTSAVHLYKKIGFIKEGIFKKHCLYQGEYYDIIKMAIFNQKFTYCC